MTKTTDLDTLAVHAGQEIEPITGALTSPIHLSTTFERDPDGEYSRGFVYIRNENPNRNSLEAALAELEGGVGAVTFGSGMAAATALLLSLSPGDEVILPDDSYFQIRAILDEIFTGWGLKGRIVDMSDPGRVAETLTEKTKLVWLESPSNPLLKIVDLKRLAEMAKGVGALTVCDSTWATPILQQPLSLGVDIVVHSTTKYLAGHHDVLGGALIYGEKTEDYDRMRLVQKLTGGVPSPFDCWLTLRGIQTLPTRVRAQTENAVKVAAFLHDHPQVEEVYYPGLADHPGHELAASQMSGMGAMLSFLVRGGEEQAFKVTAGVGLITRATSLGGTHTLIEHRASLEGDDSPTPKNLLRLSVGLEKAEALIEDLDKALSKV